jgi:hypothetical protein
MYNKLLSFDGITCLKIDLSERNGINTAITIVTANQDHVTTKYKNLKQEVLKCNAHIYFSKQCVNMNLIPDYVNITIALTLWRRNFLLNFSTPCI